MARRMMLVDESYLQMLKQYGGGGGGTEKDTETGGNAEVTAESKIVDSLPVSYRNSGRMLLSFFNDNEISYDDKHRIVIDGSPVPGSNVQDLVHDLLRFRQAVSPPPGFERLAVALAAANISREYVKNLARYEYISQLGKEGSSSSSSSSSSVAVKRKPQWGNGGEEGEEADVRREVTAEVPARRERNTPSRGGGGPNVTGAKKKKKWIAW